MTRMLVLLLLLLSPAVVVAQTDGAMKTWAWEVHLSDGAAYDRGDYEAALGHYNAAQQIRDVPRLRLQIAVIHEKLGDCTTARVLYTEIIEEGADDAVVEDATARRASLADCTDSC